MRRIIGLGAVFAIALAVILPFAGGGGPSFLRPASASTAGAALDPSRPLAGIHAAASIEGAEARAAGTPTAEPATGRDTEHLAQQPLPAPTPEPPAGGGALAQPPAGGCPGMPGGGAPGAPGARSPLGVGGTTAGDLAAFAQAYNAIRVANCLQPFPMSSIRYDACMEQRLFWMAEDPSTDPMSAWGHMGSRRSDGTPSVGCDGNLAGGSGNSGATVAQKWWDSAAHRASLYRPGPSPAGACVYFAMSHGGVPDEPASFTRAAARWGGC
ncbi:hypothetical protein [Homoserinibacter sp. YIM 151385]|uniref:hypothetical protein n=1 Tax=Homoserinibacter sp. YIM 151385 TaxID=2985506 RepID=UPI0022F12E8E|nr:hypothetical protein [Homoserinibacter sp. YIM 151385]WBU36858.1 hypothetical protein OF852_07885 [Homoserinibacter sp. YIM 151385]